MKFTIHTCSENIYIRRYVRTYSIYVTVLSHNYVKYIFGLITYVNTVFYGYYHIFFFRSRSFPCQSPISAIIY